MILGDLAVPIIELGIRYLFLGRVFREKLDQCSRYDCQQALNILFYTYGNEPFGL